ncbi:MAG: IIA-like nitrogen-regulatory protein PtsN [Pseudomonadota bacterium]|jgi:PTS system nitrogen regulatory IIA component
MNALAQLITPNNISLDIEVSSREELFIFIAQLFEKNHGIAADSVKTCLEEREALGSTALGNGIAIPHGRVKLLEQAHIGFVRLKEGIHFHATDKQPVKALVIMLVPEAATQAHLDILAKIAQTISDNKNKNILLTEPSADNIYQLLTAWN